MSATVGLFVPNFGCPHRCSFCDQRVITGQQKMLTPEEVKNAANIALESLKDRAGKTEIAFFGGSFTALPKKEMISLLEAAWPFVKNGQFRGIRCSTRPDCISPEILKILLTYGVTTIELGAQSMDDRVLFQNGRGHTAEQVKKASKMIHETNISLGLQMMTGLPGDTAEGARKTARAFSELFPSEVRIYPALTLKGTEMEKWYQEGSYCPPSLEESLELCADLLDFFEEQKIRVIRLGLHDSPELKDKLVAGPYHPAFRERCESLRWYRYFCRNLQGKKENSFVFYVPKRQISQAIGQNHENIKKLAALGYCVKILPQEVN